MPIFIDIQGLKKNVLEQPLKNSDSLKRLFYPAGLGGFRAQIFFILIDRI